MRPSRYSVVWPVLFAAVAALIGCGSPSPPPPPPPPSNPIEQALTRAADFFAAHQDEDGAWRSDFYGPLKDGPSLTSLVVAALPLAIGPEGTAERLLAYNKGQAYLARMARPDGTIDEGERGLSQPVYTAALAVLGLTAGQSHPRARDAWLKYLRERQLTEALGWDPSDKEYGGWGYCAVLPRKPAPGEARPPMLESNLSATTFALAALCGAKCPPDDPAVKAALVFVKRCQNHADDPARRDPAFDDGGFFFIYDDPARNKAGAAGKDRFGQERFASYGSATADGVRCLTLCGVPGDDPCVVAARRWLETHFDVSTHPGSYAKDREANRDAVYYYYCRSLALALAGFGAREIVTPTGKVLWADVLSEELIKRQREDGSWANDLLNQRENDPIIATADAVEALAMCRARAGK
jgi:hypothetical protein